MLSSLLFVSLLTPSISQDGFEPGATFRLFDISKPMDDLPELVPGQTPNVDRLVKRLEFKDNDFDGFKDHFYVEITAQIKVEKEGSHQFRLISDDGAILTIDGKTVVDHPGVHAPAPKTGSISLAAGWHELKVRYFEHEGGQELKLEWQAQGASDFSVLDESVLRVRSGLTRVVSPGPKAILFGSVDQRPGVGMPLDKAHPGFRVETIRPLDWEPMVGGLALRPDKKLLVTTFKPNQSGQFMPDLKDGEIWLLDGIFSGDRKKITKKKAAANLQEPLGITMVGSDVYVATRTAILQLIDKDGDDFYEEQKVVGSGWGTDNYHHFTFGLAQKDGWLYAALSTSITFDAPGINGPNPMFRGSWFRVNPKAYDPANPLANIEFLTSGHRTPNGVSEGPFGLILTGENQGSWQPSNKINVLQPGGFYGHVNNATFKNAAYPNGGVPGIFDTAPYTPPAIYLPQGEIANSPGQSLTIKSGEFKDQILITDVKYGGLRRGWLEQVDGVWQGGAVQYSQGFEVGTNRIIQAPDGSMIIGGIGATETWAWTDPKTGKWTTFGLQRLVPTNKTAFEVARISSEAEGLRVSFTRPVPMSELKNVENFKIRQWRYEPTVEYGGPKVDRENLTASKATPSADGKSVLLTLPGLKEERIVHIVCDVKSQAGEALWAGEAWQTINRKPKSATLLTSARVVTNPNVLVFSKTQAFRHDSIAAGRKALQEIAKERGWKVQVSEDASIFNTPLKGRFDVVVFLNTTGDILNSSQEANFEKFIQSGGGFVGIHSATDTEYGWPWYQKLVGGAFASHPQVQSGVIRVEDRAHPTTSFLPAPWVRVDEWYDFKVNPRPGVRVLASLEKGSVQGSKMEDHPIVWCQEFDGGRSWYTGLGHTAASYDELLFRRHIAEGVEWAAEGRVPAGAKSLVLSDFKAQGDWKADGSMFETKTGNDWKLNLPSKEEFDDVRLHVEFRVPKGGNSGVYLQGRYEIQILDSYGVANKDLQSSMAGSVYERWKDEKGYEGHPPMVNAAKPAGEWQSYDILFRAPRFRNGVKVENARFVEVRHNGVVVQRNVEVTGPTRGGWEGEAPSGPIWLQGDHGPIAYRNIWVERVKL